MINTPTAAFLCAAVYFASPSLYQEPVETEQEPQATIDTKRDAELEKWKGIMPDHKVVTSVAEECFEKPISDQTIEQLEEIADSANRTANFIGFIADEYSDYYRDNYRYEFIQKQVKDSTSAWEQKKNDFLLMRNQAYFNLGQKYRAEGEELRALMYFRDAVRLSPFDTSKNGGPGMRYKAEQEMKGILNLEDMPSYVTWK